MATSQMLSRLWGRPGPRNVLKTKKMHIGLSGKIMIIFYKILAVNTCYGLFSNISILKKIAINSEKVITYVFLQKLLPQKKGFCFQFSPPCCTHVFELYFLPFF